MIKTFSSVEDKRTRNNMEAKGPSIHAFRGDADGLLDTLLHSVANPAKPQARSLESFERDLTPYFGSAEPTDSAAPQQSPSPSRCAPRNSSSTATTPQQTHRGSNNASSARQSKRKHASPPANHSPTRPSSSVAAAAPHHNIRSSSTKMMVPPRVLAVSAKSNTNSNAQGTHAKARAPKAANTGTASASKYFCPGMFSSPKPETLPMPTGLLQRALCMPPATTVVA